MKKYIWAASIIFTLLFFLGCKKKAVDDCVCDPDTLPPLSLKAEYDNNQFSASDSIYIFRTFKPNSRKDSILFTWNSYQYQGKTVSSFPPNYDTIIFKSQKSNLYVTVTDIKVRTLYSSHVCGKCTFARTYEELVSYKINGIESSVQPLLLTK